MAKKLAGLVNGIPLPSQAENASETRTDHRAECPNCGAALQPLINKEDGSRFWGCTARTCGWTFNDPPAAPSQALCDRGHPMVPRRTKRGVAFWGCTVYPNCQRKRLVASPSIVLR